MKKRTIAIVSIALVLAILAVAVIATFPSYLFEEEKDFTTSKPAVQSETITESVQGEDEGNVGDKNNAGIEAVLPDIESETDTDTKPSTDNLETITSDDGAKLMAENAAFPQGTKFEVDKLGIFDKKYYRARHYVRDFASEYAIYEITAEKDGKSVQPIASAKVVIDIPEDYNLDYVEVYYVLLDGGVQKLNCTIDRNAKTATVSFIQSGIYILIEKDKDANTPVSSESTSTENQDKPSSNTSSNNSSSDTSSESISGTDSSKPTDSSNTTDNNESTNSSEPTDSSEISGSDTSSEGSSSEGSSSEGSSSDNNGSEDNSSTEPDPNQDTMDGWTPWY